MSAPLPHGTIAIGGPTATGKTALAVELARRTGAELLNADSRQVVRRLVVGTARPSDAELGGVPCHLLDLCEPGETFTVADWLRRARAVLDGLDARGVAAIVVGGTGQYHRALREGWRFGASPVAEERDELTRVAATPAGLERLGVEVRERDPAGSETLDLANPRRVIRALELLRAGNGSLAAARGRGEGRRLDLVLLDADGTVHGEALAARMDAMFGAGAILAEVRAELDRGTGADAVRRAGIGYAEAVDVLEGRLNVDEAEAAAVRRTSRYVKAQRTWFRHEAAVLRLERGRQATTAALADTVGEAILTPGGSPR
ncbi:MAG: tRNA (adenosine(37)-N6)-dimethylallyltransferase MiaA [Candidatus Dormibacteraeota bacterium]|nr:tRNA (adenosine(37)-N6)-dimethylallyltransferase MiaA [Candidatus Dormibacteraeota bacterium]